MKSQNDIKIEIIYQGSSNDDLNGSLDGYAETQGATFVGFSENKKKKICTRIYSFEEDENLDNFYENANKIISKFFPIEVRDLETLAVDNLKWSLVEGIYHHIEFLELKDAQNFATSFRALYETYTDDSRYDVNIFKTSDEEGGMSYLVIYGFPEESLISVMSDEDTETEELFSSMLGLKDKDKTKLN